MIVLTLIVSINLSINSMLLFAVIVLFYFLSLVQVLMFVFIWLVHLNPYDMLVDHMVR